VHTLMGHTDRVRTVAFSRDGTRVVSGSEDNFVKIWDTATGAEVRSFVGVRWGWRGGIPLFVRSPHFFVLREGLPGEWQGGWSRFLTRKS
jgi:WD40 repeat protein